MNLLMENSNSFKKSPGQLVQAIEENTTFYYSNFKLFDEDSELLFANYLSFKKNLQAFLGKEWEDCAEKTIYSNTGSQKVFVQSHDVFGTALEIWLELRRDINFNQESYELNPREDNHHNNKENQIKNSPIIEEEKDLEKGISMDEINNKENMIEEEKQGSFHPTDNKGGNSSGNQTPDHLKTGAAKDFEVFETFHNRVHERYQNHYYIIESYFKAIIHAFFVSAIKIWKGTLNSYSTHSLFGGGLLAESKKFLLMKFQNMYKTKFKILKPILVATERVKDYIYKDTKKNNIILQQNMDDTDRKNMDNFTSSLKIENTAHFNIPMHFPISNKIESSEQELKNNFKNLRINSPGEGPTSILGKRSAIQANSVVEIKKMNKKFEKLLNQNMIELAAHYVNSMNRVNAAEWQISRTFVTNMVEVNYNKLLQVGNFIHSKSDELRNDVRIRFIQPTQDFYNRLMEIWIIFKAKSLSSDIIFTDFLEKVKSNLGMLWSERFVTPTHNFFMTLYYEWHHLKQIETDTEEKIMLFIKKVKESMSKVWEENIVKKAEELIPKTEPVNKK